MNKEKVYFKVKKLRQKYKLVGDTVSNAALSKIIHYSFPIVYGGYVVDEGRKEYLAKYQRHYNVYRHCRHILSCGLQNVMLSINPDDVALSWTIDYIKEVLKDYLNKVLIEWYAFADYGEKNGRLHFHVIGCLPHNILKRDVNGRINMPLPCKLGFVYISFVSNKKAIRYAHKAIDYASKCDGIKIRNRGISKHCIYSLACALKNKENFISWESIDYDF